MAHPRVRLVALLTVVVTIVAAATALGARTVPVGWHDELNDIREWTPFPHPHAAEKLTPRDGAMRLRIPLTVEQQPAPSFYWATVHRVAEVDLDRYPVLAIRTLRLSRDTWWDYMLQEVQGGRLVGREYKTPSLRKPGLILYDLPNSAGWTGKKQVRIRLNVARVKPGCWADYTYVRFVRREDAEVLRRNPNLQPARGSCDHLLPALYLGWLGSVIASPPVSVKRPLPSFRKRTPGPDLP
jgi:hypothetical protein